MAVTAFDGGTIEDNGTVNLEDLSGIAPNVQISQMAMGRTPVMAVCMAVAVATLAAIALLEPGQLALAALLAVDSAMISGVVATNIGPLLNASVTPKIAATATGIVVGFGEIMGGAVAPALAGGIAEAHGIHTVPYVSPVAAALGLVVVLFGLKEPPRRAA